MFGVGIDDDDDVREELEGGVIGCVEYEVVVGWDFCLIWGVDEVFWVGEDVGKELEELFDIWIVKMNIKLFINVKFYFYVLKYSRLDFILFFFNISLI